MRCGRDPSYSYEANYSEKSQIANAELAAKAGFRLGVDLDGGNGCQSRPLGALIRFIYGIQMEPLSYDFDCLRVLDGMEGFRFSQRPRFIEQNRKPNERGCRKHARFTHPQIAACSRSVECALNHGIPHAVPPDTGPNAARGKPEPCEHISGCYDVGQKETG